jgi:hypothetical protein
MFEKEIKEYESLLEIYRQKVMERMATADLKEYNEILFSAHSCAIEGNSFSVNDTRELKEKGLGDIAKLTPQERMERKVERENAKEGNLHLYDGYQCAKCKNKGVILTDHLTTRPYPTSFRFR